MNHRFFILLLSFSLLNCNSYTNKDSNENSKPNLSLISIKNINSTEVYYQFYEKYGFTDVCEHYRTLFYFPKFKPNSKWKKLPISNCDLVLINKTENKVDSIPKFDFDVRFTQKNKFQDISLEMSEYTNPNRNRFNLDLETGYYFFNRNEICIYNISDSLFYYEVHKCN